MIDYKPGYWNICFAFSLRGSVFPKAFVWAFSSATSCYFLHYLMRQDPEGIGSIMTGIGDGGTNILSGFTFILGFLVVFRSQQAYSRWWEGGTLMQQLRGEWFNATSCLVAFCDSSPEKQEQVLKFQHQLVRLVSLLYASALQQICTMEDKCFYLIDITGFDKESLEFLQSDMCHDHCEVVLQWIQRLVVTADHTGVIKIAPPILSRVYNQLGNGIVNLTNARKITEFSIPFPLAQMITVMLLFHWSVIPLICATTIDTSWWSSVLCFVVVFSYWSINYIATELEMPFGDDPNDLPLHDMQIDLNASLKTLLQEKAMACPSFDFQPKTHVDMAQVKVDPGDLASGPIPDKKQDKTIKRIRKKHTRFHWPRKKPAEKEESPSPAARQEPQPSQPTNVQQVNFIYQSGRDREIVSSQTRIVTEEGEQGPAPQTLGFPASVLQTSEPDAAGAQAAIADCDGVVPPKYPPSQQYSSTQAANVPVQQAPYQGYQADQQSAYHVNQNAGGPSSSASPLVRRPQQEIADGQPPAFNMQSEACCLPFMSSANNNARAWRTLQGAVV